MLHFESSTELKRWLEAKDVDLALWGRGAAKSVADLWAEIQKGESIIQDEPPLRHVQAVRVVIREKGRILIEASQGFRSGRRRVRDRPPSEKMHPNEPFADAALRCLHEELGVAPEQVQLKSGAYRRKVWQGDPASYPGLCTRYTFHIVEAIVRGLPESDFVTEEQAVGPGEPVNLHYWEWRDYRNTSQGGND